MATITIKIDTETLAREVLVNMGFVDDSPPDLVDDDEPSDSE